jgi:hypothetical protein
MDKKTKETIKKNLFKCHVHDKGTSGALYGLGFIGAAVYYVSTATSFWMGFLGIIKAIFWPAFLVYYFMKYLGM